MRCSIIAIALTAVSAASVAPRVDDLECSGNHAPNPSDCETLLDRIMSGQASHNLQQGPRNINWGSCYVSWADYVVGSEQDLVPFISRMISICQNNGQSRSSGIIKNVNILNQSKNTAVCLSNRGNGCSN